MKTLLVGVLAVLCLAGCSDDNTVGPSGNSAAVSINATVTTNEGKSLSVQFTIGYDEIAQYAEDPSGDRVTISTAPVSITSLGLRNGATDIVDALDGRQMSIVFRRGETETLIDGHMNYSDAANRTSYTMSWRASYQRRIADTGPVSLADVFGADGDLSISQWVDDSYSSYQGASVAITMRGTRRMVDEWKQSH